MTTCPELSSLLADVKGDNEVKPRALQRSLGIYIMAEENHRKPQVGDHMIKSIKSVIASNGVPYLQMKSLVSHSTSERRKGRKKGRGRISADLYNW